MRSIFLKDLIDVWRNRKTLILSVFLPLIIVFVTVYLSMMDSDGHNSTVVLDTSISEDMEILIQDNGFETYRNHQVHQELSDNSADIGMHFEEERLIVTADRDVSTIDDDVKHLELIIANDRTDAQQTTEIVDLNQESGQIGNLFMNIIIISILFGAFPAAVTLFSTEKQQQTMETLLLSPKSRLHVLSSKYLVVVMYSLLSVAIIFIGGFGIIHFLTDEHINFTTSPVLQLSIILLNTLIYIMNLAAVLTIISILAGSFKEAQNYMMGMMLILFISPSIMMAFTPSSIPMWFYLIPSLNTNALMQVAFSSGALLYPTLMTIASCLISFILLFMFSYRLFNNDKVILDNN